MAEDKVKRVRAIMIIMFTYELELARLLEVA